MVRSCGFFGRFGRIIINHRWDGGVCYTLWIHYTTIVDSGMFLFAWEMGVLFGMSGNEH